MGVSTDAILFYGYIWEDEADLFADGDDDYEWAKSFWLKQGNTDIWAQYPSGTGGTYDQQRAAADTWMAENRQAIQAQREAIKAVEEGFGVDIGYHGSDQWRVPYLYVVESHIRAWRGGPKEVEDLVMPSPGDEWVHSWKEKLDSFADTFEIDLSEAKEPGCRWWLCSWWG
jgi:hypothetical protein